MRYRADVGTKLYNGASLDVVHGGTPFGGLLWSRFDHMTNIRENIR